MLNELRLHVERLDYSNKEPLIYPQGADPGLQGRLQEDDRRIEVRAERLARCRGQGEAQTGADGHDDGQIRYCKSDDLNVACMLTRYNGRAHSRRGRTASNDAHTP
jgi:hypothetical protein